MENFLIAISTGAVGGAVGSILTILLKDWLSNRSRKKDIRYQRKEAAYTEYAAILKEFHEVIARINANKDATDENIMLFEKKRDEDILPRLDRAVGVVILHAPKDIADKLKSSKFTDVMENIRKDLEKF